MGVQPASLPGFLKSIFSDWLVRMSGPLTVPFTFLALFVSARWLKSLYAALAVIAGFVTAYRLWATERNKVAELHGILDSNVGGPFIDIIYEVVAEKNHGDRRKPLTLMNHGDEAALNVQIQDIVIRDYRATFAEVGRIIPGQKVEVPCRIEGENVGALFRDDFVGFLEHTYVDGAGNVTDKPYGRFSNLFKEVLIPCRVSYYAMRQRTYVSKFEIRYVHWGKKARARFLERSVQ